MITDTLGDPFLEKRLARYDRWLKTEQISFSSKVIPVSASLEANQWVLPTEQATALLGKAASVAVQPCECRTHYQRCDKPLEVCFLLNGIADKLVAKGAARHVDMAQATEIVKEANQNGLVHLGLYMPDHEMYALCSCCACCCHDLQIVKRYDRKDLMVRSEYAAATDAAVCTHCGACVERCVFDARVFDDGIMTYHTDACLGCGLCVPVCPVEATRMVPREPSP